jgi:hypothetical protein
VRHNNAPQSANRQRRSWHSRGRYNSPGPVSVMSQRQGSDPLILRQWGPSVLFVESKADLHQHRTTASFRLRQLAPPTPGTFVKWHPIRVCHPNGDISIVCQAQAISFTPRGSKSVLCTFGVISQDGLRHTRTSISRSARLCLAQEPPFRIFGSALCE